MRGDVTSPRHGQAQIDGFKGLITNVPDLRAAGPGYLRAAHNVVFDEGGNARPRDGSAQYWAPTSQRIYLSEFELSENAQWTNGAVDTAVVKYGFQSRKISASQTMTRALPAPIDLTLGGNYASSTMSVNIWLRTTAKANINAPCLIKFASDAGFVNSVSCALTIPASDNVWTLVTLPLSGFTVVGTPDYTAIGWFSVSLALAGACTMYYDEAYISYSNYSKSWCTGQYQFRKISTSARYHLGVFGETLFADLNEAQAPYKVISGLTRNIPAYFETFEDRCAIFNGTDTPKVFTGTTYRNIGYAPPTADPTLAAHGSGGSLSVGDYYYGVTFVYGEGAVVHGESSMKQDGTKVTVIANDSTDITAIPVGALGSGVIKRRIYRSRVNGGPSSTKYFVAEIADNTTTTYSDVAADTTIIVNAEGPTDNGIPPVAKIGRFFQKSMVYLTNTAYYWARPGTNLNETPETVPANNYGNLANAGEAVAAVEFNQRLYIFQKRAIGKAFWQGSTLLYAPVQRTGDSGSQSVGAADQFSITVVADRYIMWTDAEGQDWKMLPNEEIFPESRDIANLKDNFNNLPITSTMDHYTTDTQAQWQLGTVGANLSTSVAAGKLSYHDRANDPFSGTYGPATSYDTTWANTTVGTPSPVSAASEPLNVGTGFTNLRWYVQATSKPLRISSLQIPVSGTGSLTLTAFKAKYEIGTLTSAVTTLATASASGSGNWTATMGLSAEVYVPMGEKVVFSLLLTGGAVSVTITKDNYFGANIDAYNSHLYENASGSGDSLNPISGGYCVYYSLVGANATLTTQTSSVFDAGATFQRWHWLSYSTSALKAGNRIMVSLQVSSDGTTWVRNPEKVYDLLAIPGSLSVASPLVNENFYFFPLRDYRVGEPFPAGTQWRYARFLIVVDAFRGSSPVAEQYSAVSTTITNTFPRITLPVMSAAAEASFTTYDKTLYARDIYTSEVVDAISLGSWGTFYADYAERQQTLTFQVITSATTDFSGSTWRDVTPGAPPPSNSLVASARYFKYRIIFQDDPSKETSPGDVSEVFEVILSWAQGSAALAPFMPPVLFYYKDYIYASWPSKTSRVHDSSVALDAFKKTYEDVPHKYSTFSAPHYVGYAVVGGMLIGAPTSGGVLSRLRNSEIADNNSAIPVGPDAYVEIMPWTMGTYNVKTLYWIYVGMQWGLFARGFFQGEASTYPTIAGNIPVTFGMTAATNNTVLSALAAAAGGSPGGAQLAQGLGSAIATQVYSVQNPLSADASTIASYSSFKPYTNEYGFNIALQERSFAIRITFRACKDSATGVAFFPILTGLGAEFHVENTRGI